MSKNKDSTCPACGVSWFKHKGIMTAGEDILKLREELAATRRRVRAKARHACSVAIQEAELRKELDELREIRDTLFAYIASQRFQPKPEPTTNKGKQ